MTDTRNRLKEFWNSNEAYFHEAQRLNENYFDGKHPFHKEMVKLIKSPGAYVLDLGCGTAEPASYLASNVIYVGVDISIAALSMRISQSGPDSGMLIQADVHQLPFGDSSFDYVISTHSLEHFWDPESMLCEAGRVLKKGGLLVLVSPCYDNFLYNIPPSAPFLSHSCGRISAFLSRIQYILTQFMRHVRLYWKRETSFNMIQRPRVLDEDYEIDNDVVYIVSAREIQTYLNQNGFTVIRIHKGKGRMQRFLVRISCLFEYFATETLFIIAEKK